MKVRDIPTDIAISASFVVVFLLAFIPGVFLMFSPDLWFAIKAVCAERRTKINGPTSLKRPPTEAALFQVDSCREA